MGVNRCKELFMAGHNCAQAVAGGFAEEMGISEEKAMALSSCFGAGICATRNICGAVTGGLMVLGCVEGKISAEEKKAIYEEGREMMEEFSDKFSTVICKELLEKAQARFEGSPLARTEEYYKARPCLLFVEEMAKMVEKRIK